MSGIDDGGHNSAAPFDECEKHPTPTRRCRRFGQQKAFSIARLKSTSFIRMPRPERSLACASNWRN